MELVYFKDGSFLIPPPKFDQDLDSTLKAAFHIFSTETTTIVKGDYRASLIAGAIIGVKWEASTFAGDNRYAHIVELTSAFLVASSRDAVPILQSTFAEDTIKNLARGDDDSLDAAFFEARKLFHYHKCVKEDGMPIEINVKSHVATMPIISVRVVDLSMLPHFWKSLVQWVKLQACLEKVLNLQIESYDELTHDLDCLHEQIKAARLIK